MVLENESYEIIGAAMAVHKELGSGFLEDVYQEALAIELKERGIPFEREKQINIIYKNIKLDKFYKSDFICYGNIIVELKAVSCLNKLYELQTLNYLKATGLKLALLINFGESSLRYKRIVL